ncbi:MAG TPA: hypothetical protein VFZ08_15145 [Terriglobia bacterium]|nr:hypothetical protein [Terriglobia bacterium]
MPTLLNNGSEPVVTAEEGYRQLERILHSASFRSSPGLQRFLEHVVAKTLQGLSHEIKEYEIAVEVLGKSSGYDPRLDTTVRVQAHRLREKLEEYYAGDGSSDEILVELPKGHYVPQFSRRSRSEEAVGDREGSASTAVEIQPSRQPRFRFLGAALSRFRWKPGRRLSIGVIVGLACAIIFFVAGLVVSPLIRKGSNASAEPGRAPAQGFATPRPFSPSLAAVWNGFWRESSVPIIAYSNSIFLVTQTSDLLRLKAGDVDGLGAPATGREAVKLAANPRLVQEAGPVFFDDDHTGTGEVMAVYYLTRLFSETGLPLTVERSQLIKTGDLQRHNVIFLGSVAENPILTGLPLGQDFVFSEPERPPTLWRNRIVNLHPMPGEKPYYGVERDPQSQVLRTDYSLISFLPGVAPGREIVVLGGLTTIGTQAAAQFVSSADGARDLLARLGISGKGSRKLPPFFQAVLKVEIKQDEILGIHCVAARALHPKQEND